MNKLPLLLKKLNENGINGAYSDIMADISKLIQDIEKAEGDVQSKINSLVADKKYDDIARFTSIPQQINECAQEIKDMFNGASVAEIKKAPASKPEVRAEEKKEEPAPVKKPAPIQTQNTPEPVKAIREEIKPAAQVKSDRVADKPVQPAEEESFITLIEDLKN